MERPPSTLVIPCEAAPRCACGSVKVSVYRDGIAPLMDNMGCELGLELIAGPFCPKCDARAILAARRGGAAGS